jgi:hypothetical protein
MMIRAWGRKLVSGVWVSGCRERHRFEVLSRPLVERRRAGTMTQAWRKRLVST